MTVRFGQLARLHFTGGELRIIFRREKGNLSVILNAGKIVSIRIGQTSVSVTSALAGNAQLNERSSDKGTIIILRATSSEGLDVLRRAKPDGDQWHVSFEDDETPDFPSILVVLDGGQEVVLFAGN